MKDDWWKFAEPDAIDLGQPGIYEWTIVGVCRYVGKAKRLKTRIRHYPNNVRKLGDGRAYRKGDPTGFRAIHRELHQGRETGNAILVGVLETCDACELIARERHWINVRRAEEAKGGLRLLNSETRRRPSK